MSLVPFDNGTRFLAVLSAGWGEAGLLDWIASIEADERVADTLRDLPLRALELYG